MSRAFRISERMMRMDDAAWARHANPWSAWSRVSVLPLFCLAAWSRVWIGWGALGAAAVVIAWVLINPRLFRAPERTDNWMSQAVLGERDWLAEGGSAALAHHRGMVTVLTVVSAIGAVAMLGGLVMLDLTATLVGMTVAMGAKLWLMDRMVWVRRDLGRD